MDLHVDGVWEGERERYHRSENAHVYEVAKVGPGTEENHEIWDDNRGLNVI